MFLSLSFCLSLSVVCAPDLLHGGFQVFFNFIFCFSFLCQPFDGSFLDFKLWLAALTLAFRSAFLAFAAPVAQKSLRPTACVVKHLHDILSQSNQHSINKNKQEIKCFTGFSTKMYHKLDDWESPPAYGSESQRKALL